MARSSVKCFHSSQRRAPVKTSPATSTLGLTVLAMLAFSGNSLLCRLALRNTPIDAASFTALRIASGALVLWFFMWRRGVTATGSWPSAAALFAYAAAFSLAYVSLPAATGALLLFGSVQLTMLGTGAGSRRTAGRQAKRGSGNCRCRPHRTAAAGRRRAKPAVGHADAAGRRCLGRVFAARKTRR